MNTGLCSLGLWKLWYLSLFHAQVAQSVAERMVSLSDADTDPVVTVTLDPAEEQGATAAELSGDEPMVVVHREPDITTFHPPPPARTSTTSNSNFAASAHASALDNAAASFDPHGFLGLSSAASVLLGAEGGLRGAEGGIREQIHNRQNARDRVAKANEGGSMGVFLFVCFLFFCVCVVYICFYLCYMFKHLCTFCRS